MYAPMRPPMRACIEVTAVEKSRCNDVTPFAAARAAQGAANVVKKARRENRWSIVFSRVFRANLSDVSAAPRASAALRNVSPVADRNWPAATIGTQPFRGVSHLKLRTPQ
jgi:hypothetical protein